MRWPKQRFGGEPAGNSEEGSEGECESDFHVVLFHPCDVGLGRASFRLYAVLVAHGFYQNGIIPRYKKSVI
jgi:hypothetical protein